MTELHNNDESLTVRQETAAGANDQAAYNAEESQVSSGVKVDANILATPSTSGR